ncbi:MAG TPA: hypothetical protein VE864_01840 [Streptosporangiaceae bacterium]|nr:hypothetical protein [Streptosporangiaceae bacterium]
MATIGLGTGSEEQFRRLVLEANNRAQQQETIRNVRLQRWEDESGAAVVMAWRGSRPGTAHSSPQNSPQLISFIPAFAALSEIRLTQCHPVREPITVANMLDTDGTQVTALAAELEQYRHLIVAGHPVDGAARLSAFGIAVEVHDDEDAFHAAPKTPDDAADPADFVPFGAFAEPAKAQPHARLTGTVIKAERRINRLTGQEFTVAITRTAGFDADVCLSAAEHPGVPAPGAIITGVVSLSVRLDQPPA